jgi:hypothetical protein
MKRCLHRLVLFLCILLLLQTLLSLDYTIVAPERQSVGEYIRMVRIAIPDPVLSVQDSDIVATQQYLAPVKDVGFLWEPELDSSDNARLSWSDQGEILLSTDRWGFINSPDAIGESRSSRPVDIIGIGASFMQGASTLFYDYFYLNDLFYYNMATHRHTLPMFNTVIEEYACEQKPDWIIYGLNEASPALIADYYAWKKSGLDWFTYHSGTWAGPPLPVWERIPLLRMRTGCTDLARAVLRNTLPVPATASMSKKEQVIEAYKSIHDAALICREHDIGFLCLVIPSKATVFYGASEGRPVLLDIVSRLPADGIGVVDLTETFKAHDDPRSLYYVVDGHWNKYGILEAARAVLPYITGENTGEN